SVLHKLREREIWIAPQIPRLHDDVLIMIAVRADEAAAKSIECSAELAGPGIFFILAGVGTKTKINAIHEQRSAIRTIRRGDFRGRQTAVQINPVVDVQRRMAFAELCRREVLESFEDDALHIRLPVAIGIFEIEKVRRAGDE